MTDPKFGNHYRTGAIALCGSIAILANLVFYRFLHADWIDSVGRIVVAFLSTYVLHRYAEKSLARYRPRLRDGVTLAVLMVLGFILVVLAKVTALSLAQYNRILEPDALYFAVPFAVGGLLVKAVLGFQYALIFVLAFSFVIDLYQQFPPILSLYIIITTLVGCITLARFRSRSAYLKAGLSISIVSIPFVLSAYFFGPSKSIDTLILGLGSGVIGGLLCAFIVAGLAPLVEYFGDYFTDISLLEIATLDHPVLKELSVQAPGTWNHSMVMGMMAEAAADAVGANPVLARVGAYYHDIGKLKKPLYFVENQFSGENRHDKLTSSMSALIVRSHVKDGLELAKKHKIPETITDFIPQHHGTALMEFFYEKAKKEAEETGAEVDEAVFRYPGPKPQTKEAGILMLADGIEASSRTISEPTPDRIQGLVQKMINKVFASGELEECELTLKDLHAIAKCFTRVLTGIYHQRIAYAEPAEKTAEEDVNLEAARSTEASRAHGRSENKGKESADRSEEDKANNKEDLKRLGI